MKTQLGYMKEFETTIVRVKHRIVFNTSTRVIDLINYLSQIDPEATVDEIEFNEDYTLFNIVFHEEHLK